MNFLRKQWKWLVGVGGALSLLVGGMLWLAEDYLKYLYSPEAQDLAGKNFYRPRDPNALAKYADQFPKLDLVDIKHFGGWPAAQKKHFDDGGIYDEISKR